MVVSVRCAKVRGGMSKVELSRAVRLGWLSPVRRMAFWGRKSESLTEVVVNDGSPR